MRTLLALLFTPLFVLGAPIIPTPTGPETPYTRTLKTNATQQSWRNALGVPGYPDFAPSQLSTNGGSIRFADPITDPVHINAGGTNYASDWWIEGPLSVANLVFDVRTFGAVGDGVTDDTDAIQRALYAATNGLPAFNYSTNNFYIPPGCATVRLPAGKFRTTASLNILSFTTLEGVGPGSVIYADFTNGPAIFIGDGTGDPYAYDVGGGASMSKSVHVRHLQIQGIHQKQWAHNATSILNHGIRIDGLLRGKFSDLVIQDLGGNGIEVQMGEFCEIERNHIRYCRKGINIDCTDSDADPTGAQNHTNTIRDNRAQVNHQGFVMNKTHANIFDRCEAEDNVAQIWNSTVNGLWDGAKLQPDAFYLPSVGVLFGTNTQGNIFQNGYIEQQYVHVWVVGIGNIGNKVLHNRMNPVEGDGTPKEGSEWCAKHDINYRNNIMEASSVSDTENNQAHILFSNDCVGFQAIGNWFAGSPEPIPFANRNTYKRIVFTTDNFTYPLFSKNFGLLVEDDPGTTNVVDPSSLFGGTNPRAMLDPFPPASGDSAGYALSLTNALLMSGRYSTSSVKTVGFIPKPFTWDADYYQANNVVQDGHTGDGAALLKTWRTVRQRTGYGDGPPTAGSWNMGDVKWNSNFTNAQNVAGWVCYASGTPGNWRGFGTDHIAEDGVLPDSILYGSFGVTREAAAANNSFIVRTRNGQIVYGDGVNQYNTWIFGQAVVGQLIPTPNFSIAPNGWIGINTTNQQSSLHVVGDTTLIGNNSASGFVNATNGFKVGSATGIDATLTNLVSGVVTQSVTITKGIVTAVANVAASPVYSLSYGFKDFEDSTGDFTTLAAGTALVIFGLDNFETDTLSAGTYLVTANCNVSSDSADGEIFRIILFNTEAGTDIDHTMRQSGHVTTDAGADVTWAGLSTQAVVTIASSGKIQVHAGIASAGLANEALYSETATISWVRLQ